MLPHILVLTERRYRSQLQPNGMVKALLGHGAAVQMLDERHVTGESFVKAAERADLVVARARHPKTLDALECVEADGAPVLDPRVAIESVRDKRIMSRMFIEAGLSVPTTVIGGREEIADSGLTYPLIIKPIFGDNGRDITVVYRPEELGNITWPSIGMIAQEYLPGKGTDLKLYVVDGAVYPVRRASPVTPCMSKHKKLGLIQLKRRMQRVATSCGDLFGLSVFGIDCLEVGGELLVVEVNEFPNYTGVDDASGQIARLVLRRAQEGRRVRGTEAA